MHIYPPTQDRKSEGVIITGPAEYIDASKQGESICD